MQLVEEYADLQINGFYGVDFNDPGVTSEQLKRAATAISDSGVIAALPTIITAELEVMCRCISNLVQFMSEDPWAANLFKGIHIEGPFLSREEGYVGAHPREHTLTASCRDLQRLLDAAEGRARLVTLAPEIDKDGTLTRMCVEQGCLVAAGHTDASMNDLHRCIKEGLSLFTHLGNACPRLMDRHDNIIYRALRFRDQLTFTLIADGFHLPEVLFLNLLDWVDHSRLCVVSDAISAAGLGPGIYPMGHRVVEVGPDKAARAPSGQHFIGAASSLRDADAWLASVLGLSLDQRRLVLTTNAGRLCGLY